MILPRLRADLAAMETYVVDGRDAPRTSSSSKLTVRTRVIRAEGDDRTPRSLVEPWANHCEPQTLCSFTTVKGVSPANEASGSGTGARRIASWTTPTSCWISSALMCRLFRTATLPAESTHPDVNSKEMFAELDRLYGDFTAWDLEYPR